MAGFFGLILGVLYFILALFGLGMAGERGWGFFGAAVATLVVVPVFYGLLGWIAGYIGAFVWNWAVKRSGGLEIEID